MIIKLSDGDKMNYTQIKPIDSLGRIIGIAQGFGKYSDDMLKVMKAELKLSMGLSALSFVRDHYSKTPNKTISLEEIYYLDALVKEADKLTKNALIYDLYTDTPELASTYSDLLQKHKACVGDDHAPLTLENAASVGALYAQSLGIAPRNDVYAPSETMAAENTAFFILTPFYDNDPEEKYELSARAFFNCEEYKLTAYFKKKIDTRGIAFTLASCAYGIYADIHAIPSVADYPELSALATGEHGRYIIASSKQNIGLLCAVAARYSLRCTYFAKATSTKVFSLRKSQRTSMGIDLSLILALGKGLYRSSFYLSDNAFFKAVNDSADAILPAVASGLALEDIAICSEYSFPVICGNQEARGEALSVILGAYRTQIELCTSATRPVIKYVNETSSSFSFSTRLQNKVIAAPLSDSEQSKLFLLSFNRNADGMPNFDSMRAMCRSVWNLISKGSVRYSRAVTNTLSDSLKELENHFVLSLTETLPIDKNSKLSGVILVSDCDIPFALLLGVVSAFPSESIELSQKETLDNEIQNI